VAARQRPPPSYQAVATPPSPADDRSPSQVALRWLIQQEGVLPIPGAMNATQAAENAGALTFTLADDEVRALSKATNPAKS
jgi:diketogulonate reductase-like aldo/keto reductase